MLSIEAEAAGTILDVDKARGRIEPLTRIDVAKKALDLVPLFGAATLIVTALLILPYAVALVFAGAALALFRVDAGLTLRGRNR